MRQRDQRERDLFLVWCLWKKFTILKNATFLIYLFFNIYIYSQIDFSTYFSMQYTLVITTRGPDHDATRLNDNFTTCFFFISSGKSSSLSSVIICDFLIHVLGFGIGFVCTLYRILKEVTFFFFFFSPVFFFINKFFPFILGRRITWEKQFFSFILHTFCQTPNVGICCDASSYCIDPMLVFYDQSYWASSEFELPWLPLQVAIWNWEHNKVLTSNKFISNKFSRSFKVVSQWN